MAWRKSPQSLVDLFAKVLPVDTRVERRPMFGYPAAFVNGNLFASLHQESLILRLPEVDRGTLIGVHGATPFTPMPGRTMREYVTFPPSLLDDDAALGHWLARALAYAACVPPKARGKGRGRPPRDGPRA